jgi:hypothetical protein
MEINIIGAIIMMAIVAGFGIGLVIFDQTKAGKKFFDAD